MTTPNRGLYDFLLALLLDRHPKKDIFVRLTTFVARKGWVVIYDVGTDAHVGFITAGKEPILAWTNRL